MLTPSLPSEGASGVPVGAWRRLDAGLFARAADGTPRTGILSMTSDDLVTGTTDLAMTYRIGPFVAVTARGTGVERIANDASETIGTDAAPQANSRIDVIWVRATFVLDGDTAPTTTFGVSKGAANQNPQKPPIPAGALELATAEVKSSDLATQTVLITQTWRYTAAAGGVVRLRNKAEMDAWAPANGALAYRLDTGETITRAGGAWEGVTTSYDPVWSAAATPPTMGQSTISGEYVRRGKWVHFSLRFQIKTGANGGTGPWRFSLPVQAAAGGRQVVAAHIENAGVAFYPATGTIEGGSNVVGLIAHTGTGGGGGLSSAAGLGADSIVAISGSYRAA
ncbi:hypothetical protein [Microbacterium sp. 16-032]|uniref:hypothetical protein n=1 Tax=Microbacterium sp. 16-032 TaxID=3239808 RepID=UPI0034E1A738